MFKRFVCLFILFFVLCLPTARAADRGSVASGETWMDLYLDAGATDTWSFYGQQGQRVIINAVRYIIKRDMRISLVPPDGGPVEAYIVDEQLDHQLLQTGVYTLRLKHDDCNYAGPYCLSFLTIPGEVSSTQDPDGGAIASGWTLEGTMVWSDMDAYQFWGQEGERVVIAVAWASMRHEIEISLYPSDGGPRESHTDDNRLDHKLLKTGLYTIVINDEDFWRTDTYHLSLMKIPGAVSCRNDLEGGLITAGQTLSGAITPGDLDAYYFYGKAGDLVTFTATRTSGELGMHLSLYPPGGCGAEQHQGACYPLTAVLQQTGLYTLLLEDDDFFHSGTYNLHLFTRVPLRPGLYNPHPASGALITEADTTFIWDPVGGATGYDLYFGEDIIAPLEKIATTTDPTAPLPAWMESATIYYWQVVAHTAEGDVKGPVWWFEVPCEPVISVDPAAVDFGQVFLAGSAGRTVTLRNTGTCPLAISLAGPTAPFSVAGETCSAQPFLPGATCAVDLLFQPTSAIPYTGNIAIISDPDAGAGTVTLSGTGIAPDLVVTTIANPPPTLNGSGSFNVTDLTLNNGLAPAGASTTRYRLSLDASITSSDPLLTGGRPVPALAPGESSSGTVTVTVPASLAPGTYYLGACADEGNVVAESNENNNCKASTSTIKVQPDLTLTSISNPPAEGSPGNTFSVTDTTANAGWIDVKPTTTRYRLSVDAVINSTDPLLTGSRAVPTLAPGGTSTGTVTVTIPTSIPQGTYYLGACADDTATIVESNETNNCKASTTTLLLEKADLVVNAVSEPPAGGYVGLSFAVTDTTANIGNANAAASTTKYRLSLDTNITSGDPLLTGSRPVPSLAPGASSSGTVLVTIPAAVAQGTYYLGACADGGSVIPEGNEGNNCRASSGTMDIRKADLTITALSDPPGEGTIGMSFSVTDTTENQGLLAAGESVTAYRLSVDDVINTSDPLLTGDRPVPSLAPGASSSGTVLVTIPSSIAQGTYYLGACADNGSAVSESDESNNCRASGIIEVKKPDLTVSAVGNPPAEGTVGMSFSATDTVVNDGLAGAGESTTAYRLSTDPVITTSDPLLTGNRTVPSLAPGASSTGTVLVTIPSSIAQGTYYLGVCADSANVVSESNESNNCLASITTIDVRKPDLRITAVSDPPDEVNVGGSFSVTDTTANMGLATAGSSSTKYRLSTDPVINGTDKVLTGSRSVPSLAAGDSSTGSVTVSIPATTPQGTYYLGACADDGKVVSESDETNNCLPSTGTIFVKKADLTVTAVSDPPPEGTVGMAFSITDTTANIGLTPVAASITKYRLSTDLVINTSDPLLTGSRSVPSLAPDATSTGTVSVTIPAAVAQGTYYLAACADDANAISESDETNNCMFSPATIMIKKPDLVVTATSDPPPDGYVGLSFTVTDTTANIGISSAGTSTNRYRMSLDTNITSSDPLLTGTRSVPLLNPGASSTGTATVTVPAAVAQGIYYLGVCADGLNAVSESNESNNCRASATTIDIRKADLIVVSVSDPPAEGTTNMSFEVTDTTANTGILAAAESTTCYRLSEDGLIDSSDPLLTGTRTVPALAPGETSTGTVTVVIPASVPQGYFFLGACADSAGTIAESDESNNCLASAMIIYVKKPDLLVIAVSDPPAEGTVGMSFTVTDTVDNAGIAPAGVSTTTYRLSMDTVVNGSDPTLTGNRTVPSLAPGENSTGTVTVTIPASVAQGVYYLAACADGANAVSESDETNNCTLSAAMIDFKKPDLTVTAVTNPPVEGIGGTTFSVTDTTANIGIALAGTSTTRYRLSLDPVINSSDTLLTGTRSVPALAPGESSTGTVTVTVPSTTAQGIYYLGACADNLSVVSESDESNNCKASVGTIWVKKADLTVTAVSDPPAEGAVGQSFATTDTTANIGLVSARSTTTRYRLSLDRVITTSDPLLTGSRTVPALAPGESSTSTVTVTIPSVVAQGIYYLAACADEGKVVSESNENNNCMVSVTTIWVKRPDLTVTMVSDPPAEIGRGGNFSVTDSTQNIGLITAGASTTRYRLSIDATITSSDVLLSGTRAVPVLAPGEVSTGTRTVTVPTNMVTGTYYLGACADNTNQVPESNENNNCLASLLTVLVQ